MESINICPHCNTNVSEMDFFCPNCGKKLKEKTLSTSLMSQILIYCLSIFLPPLGLWPAVKYLKQPDSKSKNIGIIALVLTIVVSAITIYLCSSILDSFTTEFSNQMKVYQDLNL
jgi:hypothetical protein